jgi:hypothetical protein
MAGSLQPRFDLMDELSQSWGQRLLKQVGIHAPQGDPDPVLHPGLKVSPEPVALPCVRNHKKLALRPVVIGNTSHDGGS